MYIDTDTRYNFQMYLDTDNRYSHVSIDADIRYFRQIIYIYRRKWFIILYICVLYFILLYTDLFNVLLIIHVNKFIQKMCMGFSTLNAALPLRPSGSLTRSSVKATSLLCF